MKSVYIGIVVAMMGLHLNSQTALAGLKQVTTKNTHDLCSHTLFKFPDETQASQHLGKVLKYGRNITPQQILQLKNGIVPTDPDLILYLNALTEALSILPQVAHGAPKALSGKVVGIKPVNRQELHLARVGLDSKNSTLEFIKKFYSADEAQMVDFSVLTDPDSPNDVVPTGSIATFGTASRTRLARIGDEIYGIKVGVKPFTAEEYYFDGNPLDIKGRTFGKNKGPISIGYEIENQNQRAQLLMPPQERFKGISSKINFIENFASFTVVDEVNKSFILQDKHVIFRKLPQEPLLPLGALFHLTKDVSFSPAKRGTPGIIRGPNGKMFGKHLFSNNDLETLRLLKRIFPVSSKDLNAIFALIGETKAHLFMSGLETRYFHGQNLLVSMNRDLYIRDIVDIQIVGDDKVAHLQSNMVQVLGQAMGETRANELLAIEQSSFYRHVKRLWKDTISEIKLSYPQKDLNSVLVEDFSKFFPISEQKNLLGSLLNHGHREYSDLYSKITNYKNHLQAIQPEFFRDHYILLRNWKAVKDGYFGASQKFGNALEALRSNEN